MRIRRAAPRPFAFQPARRPGGRLRFTVARLPFEFAPAPAGFVLQSGSERYQVTYRRGAARIIIANANKRARSTMISTAGQGWRFTWRPRAARHD
jgi:hypothetical protein